MSLFFLVAAFFLLVPVALVWLGLRSNRHQKTLTSLRDELRSLHATLDALQASTGERPPEPTPHMSGSHAENLPPFAPDLAPSPLHDAFPLTENIAADADQQPTPWPATEGALPLAPDIAPSQPFVTSAAQDFQKRLATRATAGDFAAHSSPPPTAHAAGPLQLIWAWLRANPLLYAGLILFITGIAFALSYLANNDFFNVSLEGRLASIALVGVAALLVGYRVSRSRHVYGGAVMGGGAVILYLVLFAGAKWGLLPLGVALAIMVLLVASVGCLAIAINMEMLAALASLGGFMAPILLSTGSDNYVGLFSFYALLCAGNVALLRFKEWDIPVLIAYAMTVGVGAMWAKQSYVPSMLLGVHIFAIVFFVLFTVAGLLLCFHVDAVSRTSLSRRNGTHASLLFGVPLLLFGIQYLLLRDIPYALALCTLCMTAWYLGLAKCLMQHKGAAIGIARDAYLIIALGFSVVTVPLAVNALWTSSIWAVQGVGMVWLGLRRDYKFARICGYLMQGLAALAFIHMVSNTSLIVLPFALKIPATWGQRCISSVLLAGSAAALLALHTRHQSCTGSSERRLCSLWQIGVLLWFFVTLGDSLYHFWAASAVFFHIVLVCYSLSALLWHGLGRRYSFPLWVLPSYLVLPFLVLEHISVFESVVVLVYDALHPSLTHTGLICSASAISLCTSALVVLVLCRTGAFSAGAWRTWALRLFTVFMLCAALRTASYPFAIVQQTPFGPTLLFTLLLGMMSLALAHLAQPQWARATHCLNRLLTTDDRHICTRTGGVFIVVLAAAVFIILCKQPGLGPAPYIPLFSSTDMAQILTLGSCIAVIYGVLPPPAAHWRMLCHQGLAVAGLVLITLSLARAVSWYTFLLFDAQVLMRAPLFLMALSLLWGSLALLLIVTAARRLGNRALWLTGASLLCLTVLKMLFFDMADSGAATRVFSFIFTGLLMLFLGYYCPLPPRPAPVPKPETPVQHADR